MRIRIRSKKLHHKDVLRAELRRKVDGQEVENYLGQVRLGLAGLVSLDSLLLFVANIETRLVALGVRAAEVHRLVASVRPKLVAGGWVPDAQATTKATRAYAQLVLGRILDPSPQQRDPEAAVASREEP